MASQKIQAMFDAYPNLEQLGAKPYPLLQITTYINEMFSIDHSKIVEQGQAISKVKETVEANGQAIIELKAKVPKLVGLTPPTIHRSPSPAKSKGDAKGQQRLQTPPTSPPRSPSPAKSKGKVKGKGKVWGHREGNKANMVIGMRLRC